MESYQNIFGQTIRIIGGGRRYRSRFEDDPECVVDEECTYDIVLVCDNVFIAKGNSSLGPIENKIYDSRIELCMVF
jgi:hypothetical protein